MERDANPLSRIAVGHLQASLVELGWLKAESATQPERFPVPKSSETACLLGWLQENVPRWRYTRAGRLAIGRLVSAGVSLRVTSHGWGRDIDTWIEPRFILTHAKNFQTRFTSIVSSRLGRSARNLPSWPDWINSAMRWAAQQPSTLLLVPDTAADSLVADCARHTQILSSCGVRLAEALKPVLLPSAWLSNRLSDTSLASSCHRRLDLSTPLVCGASCQAHPLAELPITDRIAMGLADTVFAFLVRPNGTIACLLDHRLRAPRGKGTTYIATHDADDAKTRSMLNHLLDAGGVGWFLGGQRGLTARDLALPCQIRVARESPETRGFGKLQQLAMPMPVAWGGIAVDSWPYIAHCTRSSSGPLPGESDQSFHLRAWTSGVGEAHPLITLIRILDSGRLIAGCHLTRDQQRCVSFSSVPLPKLLNGRHFQAHLGRWDWEPYGLLIRRQPLQDLGAKPVIYGPKGLYATLSPQQRPYFQPAQRRSRAGTKKPAHWSSEREWRLLQDLRLGALAPSDILVFVQYPHEAFAISRQFSWPVVWNRSA